ncbi:MAG: hypothetical protein ABI644_00570 [Arenimonas sp.]
MKIIRISLRLFLCALIASNLMGCRDLEKLFANSKEPDVKKVVVQAAAPTTTAAPKKTGSELPMACPFAPGKVPENIELYAIDGQAWIDATKKSRTNPDDVAAISISIDTPEPSALLLTAKQTALWQIKTSERTKLWGIYVTAEKSQLIAGVDKSTLLAQHYSELSDPCGFYWRPELQVHELNDFSKKLFGQPYIALPKIQNGILEIKSLEPVSSEAPIRDEQRLPETNSLPIDPPHEESKSEVRPMTLNEALRNNVIRPGTVSDIERFKSRYLEANQKVLGVRFDEYVQRMPTYVITGDLAFSGSLAGANAVVFILEKNAPYPAGDSQHSPVLDMNSGACMGRICEILIGDH